MLRHVLFITGSVLAATLFAQSQLELPQPSPASTVKQRVGVTDVTIDYSRPSVNGRAIFGDLVPYGKVWRTGANSATKITFSTDVKFGGASVPAGSYALFSIPGRDQWVVILNKVTGQWGAYSYDEKNDFVRVEAKPGALSEPVETFTIGVNDIRDNSATLNLMWDKTRVPVKLEVDLSPVIAQVGAAMANPNEKSPYVPAAMFYYEQNHDLPQALKWIDAAIAANPKAFYFVYRKALIQEKMGDKAGALATAQASLDDAKKDTSPAGPEYVHLNEALINRLNGVAPARAASGPAPRLSPADATSASIDGNRVTVIYSRPHSRDPHTGEVRKIWGGLVPYGQVWRTGANEATLLITQKTIVIGGVTLPGGGYTLYTLPQADGSAKLLINKQLGQWGAEPYDESKEFARVDLTKETLPDAVDQFTMSVEKNPAGGGFIRMKWENTQYSVPFTLKK